MNNQYRSIKSLQSLHLRNYTAPVAPGIMSPNLIEGSDIVSEAEIQRLERQIAITKKATETGK